MQPKVSCFGSDHETVPGFRFFQNEPIDWNAGEIAGNEPVTVDEFL
jgi:hypothetical protein